MHRIGMWEKRISTNYIYVYNYICLYIIAEKTSASELEYENAEYKRVKFDSSTSPSLSTECTSLNQVNIKHGLEEKK